MEAKAILNRLESLGVAVTPAGDRLRLVPGSRVPPPLLEEIKAHKDELLRHLASSSHPVIWRGTEAEYRSLLVLREAELVVAKAQLTGSPCVDWRAMNRIQNLETQISSLKAWLSGT